MLTKEDLEQVRTIVREVVNEETQKIWVEVAAMKKDIAEIQKQNNLILFELISLRKETALLRQDVEVLKADVVVLKTDVKVLKIEVVVLKEDVKKLQKDVVVIKKDIRKLRSDLHVTQKIFDDDIVTTMKRVGVLESSVLRDANTDSST